MNKIIGVKKMYKFCDSTPKWFSFENPTGGKACGGKENFGAKGHAFEHFEINEEKVLCDFSGSGAVRRIWITVNDRSAAALQGIIIKMFWDNCAEPQVEVPLGDFFCMSTGDMARFENRFFTTAEGRSFCCYIPMPFFEHCKIVLSNQTGKYINNLFYDVDITAESLTDDDMLFYARFNEVPRNNLCEPVEILPFTKGCGRFLGTSIGIYPDTASYGNLWWGEGEMKAYLDGDKEYPTVCGTGAEDYVGSAWELGTFANLSQGCIFKSSERVSMYRFHDRDAMFFKEDIRVTLDTLGGGMADNVKNAINSGAECLPVTFDNGDVNHIYKTDYPTDDLTGYVCFYRRDRYRITSYYYLKKIV